MPPFLAVAIWWRHKRLDGLPHSSGPSFLKAVVAFPIHGVGFFEYFYLMLDLKHLRL